MWKGSLRPTPRETLSQFNAGGTRGGRPSCVGGASGVCVDREEHGGCGQCFGYSEGQPLGSKPPYTGPV